jgi:hypothetical protein
MGFFFGLLIGIISANLDRDRNEKRIIQHYNDYALRTYASKEFMQAYSNPQMEWRFNR